MDIGTVLWPENGFAQLVIRVLIIAFIVWISILVYSFVRLQLEKKRLAACVGVTKLRRAVSEANLHSWDEAHESKHAEDAFEEFIRDRGLPGKDPIALHLKTIYEAGCFETRLDVGELLRHTNQRLFSWNTLLRSLLGLFIVLGLIGTLAGLAISLKGLSETFGLNPDFTNANTRLAILKTLQGLKGAFSPSIAGVGLTIMGVLFFSLYLRFICNPVQIRLGQLTIYSWVPQLLPTTPQRLVETLRRSEEHMRQNFQSAKEVAEFAKDIKDEASEFNGNLKASNKVLKQLSSTGSSLSSFSMKFEEAASKLVNFQDDLGSLYKESLSTSVALKENVGKALKEAQEYQRGVNDSLNVQGGQLQTIAMGLKSYETAYILSREKIDQGLQRLMEAVQTILSQTEAKNLQLIERFGDPLIQKLHEKFTGLDETLNRELQAIVHQYQEMDTPIRQAAQNVSGALETIDKRTTALKEDLQRAFLQREESMMKQMSAFNDLGNNICALLEKMETSSRTQNQNIQILAQSISGLQETIKLGLEAERRHKDERDDVPVEGERKRRFGIFIGSR